MWNNLAKPLAILVMASQTVAIPASLMNSYPASRSPNLVLRQDDDSNDDNYFDATDLSGITTLAAIGDSYSAGIGAGDRLGSFLDALEPQSDYACSRYDHSYPYLVSQDPRLSEINKFQFVSCSGAKTADVLEHQIPQLDSNQQAIMLSIGGNDVELVNILNQCIFQWAVLNSEQVSVAELAATFDKDYEWAKGVDWSALGLGCEGQLSQSASLISSSDFSNSLDSVLQAAQGKLAPGGHIYMTGYAKFFAEDLSDDCDDVTWSTYVHKSYNIFQPTAKLISQNRKTMNDLVDQVNSKISDAVQRAGSSVTFVNYDAYVGNFGGRFCEAGVDESTKESNTRTGLMFYELNTWDPQGATPWKRTGGDPLNGTFSGEIDVFAQITEKLDPDATFANPEANSTTGDISDSSASTANSGAKLANSGLSTSNLASNSTLNSRDVPADDDEVQVPNLLPDGYGRVFHPQILLHQLIANLVVFNMMNTNEVANGMPTSPESFTISACPAATEPTKTVTVVPVAPTTAVPAPPAVVGGFKMTCDTISLQGNLLFAFCGDTTGRNFAWQQQDLNLCLANDHGNLVNRDTGNAFASCSGCTLNAPRTLVSAKLTCSCSGADSTTIELNDFISNKEGKLLCSGHLSAPTDPHPVSDDDA